MEASSKSTLTLVSTVAGAVLAIAGVVGSATAYLHRQIDRVDAKINRVDAKINRVDAKVDALARDAGRLEGLILGLHGVKVFTPSPNPAVAKTMEHKEGQQPSR